MTRENQHTDPKSLRTVAEQEYKRHEAGKF